MYHRYVPVLYLMFTPRYTKAYSPDLAPSNYPLLKSMGHALAGQRFGSYEDVKKSSMSGSQQKRKTFTGMVVTNFPEDMKNV